MGKFTVHQYGYDSSGRAVYMTEYMRQWLDNVLARPRVKPFADKVTVVQGAWMKRAGGGATASAGYHDGGGCLDFRTWNLTTTEINHLIVAMRLEGAAAWRRDSRHGMDPHIHITLGGDAGMTSGAVNSWQQYLNGTNGLASYGSDYEWRPDPIRRFHYKAKKPRKYPKPWGEMVNRHRVNRSINHPKKYRGKAAMKDMREVRDHIRKHTGYEVVGFDKYPESRIFHTLKWIAEDNKLKARHRKGKLTRKLAKILGLRSRWLPFPLRGFNK